MGEPRKRASLRAIATVATALSALSGALAGCAALPDPWLDAGRIAWFHIGSSYGQSRSCLDAAVQGDAGTDDDIAARIVQCFDTSLAGESPSQRIDAGSLTGNGTWLLDSTVTEAGLHLDAASLGQGTAAAGGVTKDAVLMVCWTADLGSDRVWLVEGRPCETYLLNLANGGAESVSIKNVLRHVEDTNPGI